MSRLRRFQALAPHRCGGAVVVALGVVVGGACGTGNAPSLSISAGSMAPTTQAPAGAPPLLVGPVAPLVDLEVPTVVEPEPFPEPERPAVGEGQFLGAMKLQRRSHATPEDSLIVHRLNSGFWVVNTDEQHVDPDPLLDYGPVFDQTSDPPGAVGGTTLVAMHNVTKSPPELTRVTVDGVTHSESRMMLSRFNEDQMALDPARRRYQANATPGDTFELILNNPNGTVTVLTYEVNDSKNVDPLSSAFDALREPPVDPTASRLVVYSCWEPGDDKLRQAVIASLRTRETRPGAVPDPGPQPRRASAAH